VLSQVPLQESLVDAYWYVSFILGCYALFLVLKNAERKGVLTLVVTVCLAGASASADPGGVRFLAALAAPMFLLGMWAADHVDENGGFHMKYIFCMCPVFGCS